jgi:hypothetical protein
MPSLLDALRGFNRRERQILIGWVLDRLSFPLGHEFRDALTGVLGVSVPADAYVAMDYNLNWLCAALIWSDGRVGQKRARRFDPDDGIDLGDNSDSDLVVAFGRGSKTHVVLLEAKGYTGWTTKQLKHKCARLRGIFGETGTEFGGVVPSWVFVSPTPPPHLDWAPWMLGPDNRGPRHLSLPQPSDHKFAIARCDEMGKKAREGGYWQIQPDPWPGRDQEGSGLT